VRSSRVIGDLVLGSSRAVDCKTSLLGCTGGEERRELAPDTLPEDRSATGAGDGERRLQVSEVGPLVTRSSRRRGLLERVRQSPLGPVGGDLLEGRGDLTRGGGRLSYGDLDLRLLFTVSKQFVGVNIQMCYLLAGTITPRATKM